MTFGMQGRPSAIRGFFFQERFRSHHSRADGLIRDREKVLKSEISYPTEPRSSGPVSEGDACHFDIEQYHKNTNRETTF